jgi:hypothetical protein
MPKQRRIAIPDAISRDRAVRALITQWRNLHLRHRECQKRIAWRTPKAATLEKKRRKEKWQIVARILEIERQIVVWCAKETKHPAIYSSRNGKVVSRLMRLRHQYDENRRLTKHLIGPQRQTRQRFRAERMAIVAEMRGIIRSWMIAVLTAVYPDTTRIPAPLPLHPAELRPRKVQRAQQKLLQEIAA